MTPLQLIEKSKQYFKFEYKSLVPIDIGFVKTHDGQIWFDRRWDRKDCPVTFETPEDCLGFFEEARGALLTRTHDPETVYTKMYETVVEKAETSSDDYDKIRPFLLDPAAIGRADLKSYRPRLANNVVDWDGERFSLEFLKSLSETIPGKPLLIGHQWGPPGEGLFYDSTIEEMTGADFQKIFPTIDKSRIDQAVQIDGRIFVMRPKFYVLVDDKRFIRKVDAGIIRHMSIGVKAPRKDAIYAEDGETVLYYEYNNDGSRKGTALEGSFVWLGAQQGSENASKTFVFSPRKPNAGNAAAKANKTEDEQPADSQSAPPKEQEKINEPKKDTEKARRKTMEFTLKSLGKQIVIQAEEAAVKELLEGIDKDVEAKILETTKTAGQRGVILDAVKTGMVVTDDAKAEEIAKILKAKADQFDAMKKALVETLVSKMVLAGMVPNDAAQTEQAKKLWEAADIQAIQTQTDHVVKQIPTGTHVDTAKGTAGESGILVQSVMD